MIYDREGRPIDDLPDRRLRDDEVAPYREHVPVLFGHYWWRRESAEVMNPLATCVDFSVAKYGVLTAYRWNTDDEVLHPDRFEDY